LYAVDRYFVICWYQITVYVIELLLFTAGLLQGSVITHLSLGENIYESTNRISLKFVSERILVQNNLSCDQNKIKYVVFKTHSSAINTRDSLVIWN